MYFILYALYMYLCEDEDNVRLKVHQNAYNPVLKPK